MTYLPVTPGAVADHVQTDIYSATGGQTNFTLTKTPNDPNDVKMMINGVDYINGADYSITGTTCTWLNVPFTLSAGDKVELVYHF
jgi:hypothetical protein